MTITYSKSIATFGVVILVFQILYFDFGHISSLIHSIKLELLLYCWLLIVVSSIYSAINAWLLLGLPNNLSFKTFIPIYWTAWAFALVIPGQVGDTATYFIKLRKESIPANKILAGSLADKLVSFFVSLAFALPVLLFLPIALNNHLVVTIIIGLLITLIIGVIISIFIPRIGMLYRKIFLLTIEAFAIIKEYTKNYTLYLCLNLCLTILRVLATGGSYYVCLKALNVNIESNFIVIVMYAMAASLVAYIPISFNGVGTVEAFAVFLFGSIGIEAAETISMYIILRILGISSAWLPLILTHILRKQGIANSE